MSVEYTYDPEERFGALGALLDYAKSEGARTSMATPLHKENKMCVQAEETTAELSWDPVTRYNALAWTFKAPRGAKTSEHLRNLRASCPSFGSLGPAQERVGNHELTYDPVRRFAALAKVLKAPRSAKTTEHLENLRQSNPAFGSLAPAQERVGKHELTYDPVKRYALMVKADKAPRGAKTTEHLENLRLSDPTFGSLAPAQERVGKHELTYDPVKRYVALAKLMSTPRGAKTLEHLEQLRINDPKYGSLAPQRHDMAPERKWTERGPAAGWLEHEAPQQAEAAGSDSSEEWVSRRPSGGRLPRILSNQMMHFTDEDEDEASDAWSPRAAGKTWAPPSPKRNPNYFPAQLPATLRRLEDMGGDIPDDASMRSDARTSLGLRNSERSSNDTIVSFLDDHDVHASGEFSAEAIRQGFKDGLDKVSPVPRQVGAPSKAKWSAQAGKRADAEARRARAQQPSH